MGYMSFDRRDNPPRQWWKHLNEATMEATVDVYDADTDEIEVRFKFEVCGTCNGKGSHVNPSIDAHGIGREEFDEDPDFEEAYFAGRYDVACAECGGKRVVAVTDDERVNEMIADRAECDRIQAAERAMGA